MASKSFQEILQVVETSGKQYVVMVYQPDESTRCIIEVNKSNIKEILANLKEVGIISVEIKGDTGEVLAEYPQEVGMAYFFGYNFAIKIHTNSYFISFSLITTFVT